MNSWKFPILSFDKIIDGDTIRVMVDQGLEAYRIETFRLAKINTPEMNTPEGPVAKLALTEYINKKSLNGWTIITYKKKDAYGRRLGTLLDPDGNDVNKWMVDNGYAAPFMVF